MRRLLVKLATTVKNEGISAVFRKASRRLQYAFLRINEQDQGESDEWKAIRGIHRGKRAFLIGNGPSLNKTPLHLLEGEKVMVFNRFGLMADRVGWKPDFYMVSDNLVLQDLIRHKELDERIADSTLSFFPDIHFRGNHFRRQINASPKVRWLRQRHGVGFSQDLPTVFLGGSVIYEGFQVLVHLGFREIYFVGVDMNFKTHNQSKPLSGRETDIESLDDDDPNHFDPRYFGSGRRYHQPEDYVVKAIMNSLEYLARISQKMGLSIYNAGYDSKVDVFPRVDFRKVLGLTELAEDKSIDRCFQMHTRFDGFRDFLKASVSVGSADLVPSDSHFHLTGPEAWREVPNYVITHIPIGPHRDTYYFVKRF